MSVDTSDKELYEQAKKRVEEKKGFLNDLIAYIVVNTGLFFIWLMTGAGYPWFIWPIFGWGIGLVFHFLSVYVFIQQSGWEKREIEKEMERLKKDGGAR